MQVEYAKTLIISYESYADESVDWIVNTFGNQQYISHKFCIYFMATELKLNQMK